MREHIKATRAEIIGFLFVVLVIVPLSVVLTRAEQRNLFKHEVKQMNQEMNTMKMKTVCIGRFLIDVPDDAKVSFRPAFLAGWNIATITDETEEQFADRLATKEIGLKGQKNQKGWESLESATKISHDGLTGKVFIFGREWDSGFNGKEHYEWVNVAATGLVRAKGISFNFDAKVIAPRYAEQLPKLITQLKPLAENEVPTQAGFCFNSGIISDPLTAEQRERVVMSVSLKDHHDVSIVLATMAGTKPNDSLLARDDKIRAEYASVIRVFRRGALAIGGVSGEELLEGFSENNGTTSQSFAWESPGTEDDVFLPFLSLEMSTGHGRPGKPVQSSFSDGAALALWDKISSSLRIRPTKIAKPVVAAPVIPPRGTHVWAQQPCPASGWWKCHDGDERIKVESGEYQYFRLGDRMPQAVLLGPATLWQRITGDRPRFSHKADTLWTLANRRKEPRKETAAPRVLATAAIPTDGASTSNRAELDEDGESMKTPAGTLVATGAACPESGWWTCVEAGALDGAQWFGQGEPLPDATFIAMRTWIDRLRGRPAVYRIRSAWKLIRPDEAPWSSPAAGAAPDQHAATTPGGTDELSKMPKSAPQQPNKET